MGASRVFTKSMPSGDSTVSFFDATKGWTNVYLQIPTFTSTTSLDIYAAATSTAFYQIRQDKANTTTVQYNTFIIAATMTSGGAIVPIPGGFQYYKIQAVDSAPAAAMPFSIICSDS